MSLYKYKGEVFYEVTLFHFYGEEALPEHLKLGTLSYEKATKFGFEKHKKNKSWFIKWLPEKSCHYVGKGSINRYRVRYKDNFFKIIEETKGEVKLLFPEELDLEIYKRYDVQPMRMAPAGKWVKRDEITEMKGVKERIGLYQGMVVYIIDKNEKEFLIRAEYIGQRFEYKPKEKIKKGIKYYVTVLSDRKPLDIILSEDQVKNWDKERWRKVGDHYRKWIPKDNVCMLSEGRGLGVGSKWVKYAENFFILEEEKGDEVKLVTNRGTLRKKYNMKLSTMWVKRDDITELEDLDEKYANLIHGMGDIFLIEDETENEYLLRPAYEGEILHGDIKQKKYYYIEEDSGHGYLRKREISKEMYEHWKDYRWTRKGKWFEKWVPKEDVFVYNETDEPLRY